MVEGDEEKTKILDRLKKIKEEAEALRAKLVKEFEESLEAGETIESMVSKIVRRPAGRSTSFLNISREPDRYVAAKGIDIFIDEDGNKTVTFY